jgi:hypothetical protein
MTVDQLILKLQAGKVRGDWTGAEDVSMCERWPYLRNVEDVKAEGDHDSYELVIRTVA